MPVLVKEGFFYKFDFSTLERLDSSQISRETYWYERYGVHELVLPFNFVTDSHFFIVLVKTKLALSTSTVNFIVTLVNTNLVVLAKCYYLFFSYFF